MSERRFLSQFHQKATRFASTVFQESPPTIAHAVARTFRTTPQTEGDTALLRDEQDRTQLPGPRLHC